MFSWFRRKKQERKQNTEDNKEKTYYGSGPEPIAAWGGDSGSCGHGESSDGGSCGGGSDGGH